MSLTLLSSKSSIKYTSEIKKNIVLSLFIFKQYSLAVVCLFVYFGKQISKGLGLNELLNIHNSAKVVNVKDPDPGTWTIKV